MPSADGEKRLRADAEVLPFAAARTLREYSFSSRVITMFDKLGGVVNLEPPQELIFDDAEGRLRQVVGVIPSDYQVRAETHDPLVATGPALPHLLFSKCPSVSLHFQRVPSFLDCV